MCSESGKFVALAERVERVHKYFQRFGPSTLFFTDSVCTLQPIGTRVLEVYVFPCVLI